jgi:heat shock protein beta
MIDELASKEDSEDYKTFWENFGRNIKIGVIEDEENRKKLAKLLRFNSSAAIDAPTRSLDQYVSSMKSGQKSIYYMAGDSVLAASSAPFVEKLVKKGYEVLYLTDVLDEYLMQHLLEYDDKKFQDAAKEDLKMSDKDEQEKKRDKELKEEFKDLTKWWKDALGSDKVSNVKVSTRLHTTPCVVVVPKYAQSANMERIMASQAFSSQSNSFGGSKVLEINPRHPLIAALKDSVSEDAESESAKETAKLLFDTALLESGFSIADTKQFSGRMYALLQKSLGVEGELQVEDEHEEVEEAAAEEEAEEAEVKDEL